MLRLTKTILLLTILLLSSKLAYAATQWCTDVTASSEVCYDIETGSGVEVIDQTSNGNNADFKSAGEPAWSTEVPTSGTDGFEGTSTWSVDFSDDSDDTLIAPDSASLDISTNTFASVLWIRPSFTQTTPEAFYVFDKTNGNSSGYLVFFIQGIDDFRFRLFTSVEAGENVDTIGLSWTANTWHHIATRYDGTIQYIYWDGVEENTEFLTGTITTNATDLHIGSQDDASDSFEGNYDEFAIFSSALGADATDLNDIMVNGLVQAVAGRKRIFFLQ